MDRLAIGVVGLGTMGLGLVQVFAAAGHPVLATDAQSAARDAAMGRLADTLGRRVAAGKLTLAMMQAALDRITIANATADLGPATMAVEAISEDLRSKRAVIAALEAVLAADAIIATNTSALSVTALAAGAARPERILGLHFFNPAPSMTLVELVAGVASAPWALAHAEALIRAVGKVVIRCADRPGFIVNRCARPFYGEALAMVEEGRTASDIDAATQRAGYRLGPLSLIDLIGADINLAATESVYRGMGGHPRYHPFASLQEQVAKGALGRKAGRGFVFPNHVGDAPADADAIVLRIEAVLANEAASLIDEGAVDADSIDMAMRLGLNFPRGPIEAARAHGVAKVIAVLADLAARAPAHLKGRYDASPALLGMART